MDDIINSIKTTKDRDEFIIDIDEFEKTKYLSSEDGVKELRKIKSVNQELIRSFLSRNSSSKSLSDLKDELVHLEVVRIVLSFDPKQSTIEELSRWSRENLDKSVLIYVETDKTIGAGVVVTYKGKYVSHTIEDKLEEYFNTNKDSLISKIKANQPTNLPNN